MWTSLGGKLAQSDTVRTALAFVARGEARLGIVYATDARAEPGVKGIDTFPAWSHEPIVYPVALTVTSANPAADAFLAHLKVPAATQRFIEQGFVILRR
jgi:molybdate transport system substrate-binding protein